MTYETNITLDLSGEQYNPPVTAMQGDKDSRYIIATLTAQGQPYTIPAGATARISVMKPHGECVLNDAEIEENRVKILLTEQILIDFGIARAEVMLFQGAALLSSAVFDLVIRKRLMTGTLSKAHRNTKPLWTLLPKCRGLRKTWKKSSKTPQPKRHMQRNKGITPKRRGRSKNPGRLRKGPGKRCPDRRRQSKYSRDIRQQRRNFRQ